MKDRDGDGAAAMVRAGTSGERSARPTRDCEVVVWLDGQVIDAEVRGLAGLSQVEAAALASEMERVARLIRAGWAGRVVLH